MADFYEVLGVARDADPQAIKKAYRKLAHRYHPDKNPGDKSAAERFREATRAYDVLADPGKRKRYDRFGAAGVEGATEAGSAAAGSGFPNNVSEAFSDLFGDFLGRRGGSPGSASRRGADRTAQVRVDFAVAVDGGEHLLQIPRQVGCRRGRVVVDPCEPCRGSGQVSEQAGLKVRIPPGCRDGAVLSLAGQGDAGVAGGPPGDLRLAVTVGPHPLLGRQGGDLTCEAWLTAVEAALGAQVTVPTLATPVRVKVPPGSQDGAVLRLRGKGARAPGQSSDLLVTLRVEVPGSVVGDERRLWQQLAERPAAAAAYPRREAWRHKVGEHGR